MEPSTIVASEKSTHMVEVFTLEALTKHPNADSLSLIRIGDTDYTYVGRTDDWQDKVGTTVAWIPPDSLVDVSRPEFLFLANEKMHNPVGLTPNKNGKYARIKAKKLRGALSYGLMVPFPNGTVGENAAEKLGVLHYEPLMTGSKASMSGDDASPPSGVFPKYDVDAFLKYGSKMFVTGELVCVTEKIHGANARYVFKDGAMHCGSRNLWKKEFSSPPALVLEELIANMGSETKAKEVYERAVTNFKPKKNLWWSALDNVPALRKYCEANPGHAVYGEVYGQVQNLKYGAKNGEVWFRAFDILTPDGSWMDADQFLLTCKLFDIPCVPVLEEALAFDFDTVVNMAVGNSLIAGAEHIREGVVVKPVKERWNDRLGRVNLKVINPNYLEL